MPRKISLSLAALALLWFFTLMVFFVHTPMIQSTLFTMNLASNIREYTQTGATDAARNLLSDALENSDTVQRDADIYRYDLGNLDYMAQEYVSAFESYVSAEPTDIQTSAHRLHNIGNTLYRIGESIEILPRRLLAWEQAVIAYERALLWHEDRETRENLEFVRDKIRDLQEQIAQAQSTSSPRENTGDATEREQSWSEGEATPSPERGPNPGQNWTNQWTFDDIGVDDSGGGAPLSPAETEALRQRLEELERFESENQGSLNRDGRARMPGWFGAFSENTGLNDALDIVDRDW